jgi:hypothetical protein
MCGSGECGISPKSKYRQLQCSRVPWITTYPWIILFLRHTHPLLDQFLAYPTLCMLSACTELIFSPESRWGSNAMGFGVHQSLIRALIHFPFRRFCTSLDIFWVKPFFPSWVSILTMILSQRAWQSDQKWCLQNLYTSLHAKSVTYACRHISHLSAFWCSWSP